jgi:SAM-dependent methyltransferase
MDAASRSLTFNLSTLHDLSQPPDPFTPGLPLWADPHISGQMLRYHLDPDSEAASRPPAVIEKSAHWIVERLGLPPLATLLDLGCGPGLYAEHFACHGLRVTGLDISCTSIDYARRRAQDQELPIVYKVRDFLTLDYDNTFDAVCQIYGEISVFAPAQCDDLLRRIYRALKPGGAFVFDVSTPTHRAKEAIGSRWYTVPDGGFWKPGPHLVLEKSFEYPDNIHLDQFAVLEADGALSVYRTWFLDYTPETIRPVVEAAGFSVEALTADLCGTPLPDGDQPTEWIGVVARKPG